MKKMKKIFTWFRFAATRAKLWSSGYIRDHLYLPFPFQKITKFIFFTFVLFPVESLAFWIFLAEFLAFLWGIYAQVDIWSSYWNSLVVNPIGKTFYDQSFDLLLLSSFIAGSARDFYVFVKFFNQKDEFIFCRIWKRDQFFFVLVLSCYDLYWQRIARSSTSYFYGISCPCSFF